MNVLKSAVLQMKQRRCLLYQIVVAYHIYTAHDYVQRVEIRLQLAQLFMPLGAPKWQICRDLRIDQYWSSD